MPEGPKQRFFAIMHSIFAYKIGPLALHAKDYLAALARTRGRESLAADVEAIEVLPFRAYRYVIAADGHFDHAYDYFMTSCKMQDKIGSCEKSQRNVWLSEKYSVNLHHKS